jgi:hypothetical protein
MTLSTPKRVVLTSGGGADCCLCTGKGAHFCRPNPEWKCRPKPKNDTTRARPWSET